MLSERLDHDLEESVQLRMKAIGNKISLAFTFCETVETEARCGRRDEAEQLLGKLCTTIDHLDLHINPYINLPDTFLAECREQLARLEERVSLIDSEMRASLRK